MRALTLLTSALMVVLGLAIVARTVASGGGPAAIGIVLGVLFVAGGALRLYVERGRR